MLKTPIYGERIKLSDEDLKALDQYVDDVKNKRPRPYMVDYLTVLRSNKEPADPKMFERLRTMVHNRKMIIFTPTSLT